VRARGVVVVAGLLLAPVALLVGEGLAAGARTYVLPGDAPVVRGEYGAGPPLTVAVLGDSTGAGLGVDAAAGGTAADTVGGQLAGALAAQGRRVSLRGFAVSGARSRDLAGQVDQLVAAGLGGRSADPAAGPLVAVVLVGANDATHLTGLGSVGEAVGGAVARLRGLGARVVVGTCPDLGSARAFAQPLRLVVAWRGRAVGRVEVAAVQAAGGAAVDLAALTGPAFRADRATLSRDLFHPSMRGYGLWAAALLPAVRRAAA